MVALAARFPSWPHSAQWNDAIGGSTSEFTSGLYVMRRHLFLTPGAITLTVVSNPKPFTVMWLGPGGSGGGGFIGAIGYFGGKGGGGGSFELDLTLPLGSNAGVVGTPGAQANYNAGGSTGSKTQFAGHEAGAGGGGQSGQGIQDGFPYGQTGSTGSETGLTTDDGGKGQGNSARTFPGSALRTSYGLTSNGDGGNGGHQDPGVNGGHSSPGQPGALAITYAIGLA